MAAAAAAALALSLLLPWYQKSYVPSGSREFVQTNLSAFGVFSFVEAAVLLVAAGVLYLIWARSDARAFHLPGGDGVVISAAGGWAVLLLVWRLFDKPNVDEPGATVGIQWGMFGALLAAGALVAAGARVRAAHRPEPPNPVADGAAPARARRRPVADDWSEAPARGAGTDTRRARRAARAPREGRDPADAPTRRIPHDDDAVTDVLGDRPAWQGEPPPPDRLF
jgi:hypothetical protein